MPRSSLQIAAGVIFVAASCIACGNSGVVAGAKDTHCEGVTAQPASFFECPSMADPNAAAAEEHEEEMVNYNAEADDDDCKYHAKWSATNVAKNTDVTFTVDLAWKADGKPVEGGAGRDVTYLVGSKGSTHPMPVTNYTSKETKSGEYTIGPVRFDESGKWMIEFHFFGNCAETDNSKHGHVGFYVQVP